MAAERPAVSAAVMAGGRSRRMGTDKAFIELAGRPIIARVLDVMREVADEVLVVANDTRYATLGVRVVPDRFADGGALGGIATGVGAAAHDRVLVVACDMPFLRADVWRALIARADGFDAVVPKLGDDHETLHALYTKACLPAMERALADGRLRVISFFADVRVRDVPADELRGIDPGLRAFTNVNTPEELAALAARPDRREALARRISAAVDRVVARVEGLSAGQWAVRCAPEGWSVGLEAQHIAVGLARHRGWIEAAIRGAPPFAFDRGETDALNAATAAAQEVPDRDATVALLRSEGAETAGLIRAVADADLDTVALRSGRRELTAERVASVVMVRHIEDHLRSIEGAVA